MVRTAMPFPADGAVSARFQLLDAARLAHAEQQAFDAILFPDDPHRAPEDRESADERRRAIHLHRWVDELRTQIAYQHAHLVDEVVRSWADGDRVIASQLADTCQQALLTAIDTFDHTSGGSFVLFARVHVIQAARHLIEPFRRLPDPEVIQAVRSARDAMLLAEFGIEPMGAEVIERTTANVSWVSRPTILRVLSRDWLQAHGEVLPEWRRPRGDDPAVAIRMRQRIHLATVSMTPVDRALVLMHSGVDGVAAAPLREVSARLGLDEDVAHTRYRMIARALTRQIFGDSLAA